MQHRRARRLAFVLAPGLLALVLGACGGDGPAPPTETLAPRPTATRTFTPTPTRTPAPTATDTPPVAPPTNPPAPTSPPQGYAQVVRYGNTSTMTVTLTFDAGSDAGYTSQILDVLSQRRIVAAFGITGAWAEENPALLQRIVREGHTLINHTYDHASFTGLSTTRPPLSQEERWEELDLTEAAVQRIAGASTLPYFRPPYGDHDDSVNADVFARGYRYNVMWAVDSFGWYGYDVARIIEKVMSEVSPGAIIIMHVGSASQDGPALARVIDGLEQRGYSFAPLTAIAPR